jgi:hypothetical protein
MSLLIPAGLFTQAAQGPQRAPSSTGVPSNGLVITIPAPLEVDILEVSLQPYKLLSGVTIPSQNQYSITGPRPLATAAQLLSQKLAVPVSYEDASWASDADVTVATLTSPIPVPAWVPRPLVPREHTFGFTLPSLAELRKATAEPVIQSVIDSYHRSGNPGKFKVIRYGTNEFSIVAVSAADQSGKDTIQLSPLDTRITFPAKQRSRLDAIEEIRNIVSNASANLSVDYGAGVVSGNGYLNYLSNNRTDTGASNETAREVLSRVMGPLPGGSNAKLAWIMVSTPRSKDMRLVLYDVTAEVTHSDGSQWLAPVVWTSGNPNR